MTGAYRLGLFDYNECFLGEGGFLTPGANEEKHLMSLYIRALCESLAARRLVFGRGGPVHWLEPGIGDGSSTAKFLRALAEVHATGFVVHGSDFQPDSVQKARDTLHALEPLGVKVAEVVVRDAFGGERLASQECDFALLSHFVYHVKTRLDGSQLSPAEIDAKVSGLVRGVMGSLRQDGLALAFHEGRDSDMFGKVGLLHGSAMADAPERIARAAAAIGKAVVAMPLESKLYFPHLPVATVEGFKSLDNWQRHDEGSPEASWLKKLLFALYNTPVRAADGSLIRAGGVRDMSAAQLGAAIDYLRDLLAANAGRDGDGAHLVIRSEMQAILNDAGLERPVREAFAAVEGQVPELRARARQAMHTAGA